MSLGFVEDLELVSVQQNFSNITSACFRPNKMCVPQTHRNQLRVSSPADKGFGMSTCLHANTHTGDINVCGC